MNNRIEQIQKAIAPLRQQILNHKVYSVINEVADLRLFMQYHVFAVWDFMSLLKTLQQNLTCTKAPWFPVGDAETRYLINEIVTGEESDIDEYGTRKSHFELYLDAMQQCGADTEQMAEFLEVLKAEGSFSSAFDSCNAPRQVRRFVNHTFNVIGTQQAHIQAVVFTFGREDLIPGMFVAMVNDIYQRIPQTVSVFKYYLERHIEVDGDHHSHLALQMTENLCGDNEEFWNDAQAAVIDALQMRIELWDGVYDAVMQAKLVAVNA